MVKPVTRSESKIKNGKSEKSEKSGKTIDEGEIKNGSGKTVDEGEDGTKL